MRLHLLDISSKATKWVLDHSSRLAGTVQLFASEATGEFFQNLFNKFEMGLLCSDEKRV
tara:strand:+ start:540 stop:716 length:177 start_codon:yes stop_codon:yes gene_type:complete